MLLNLSNHPFRSWPENQRQEAISRFENVEDLPFPIIDPSWTTDEVLKEVEHYIAIARQKDPNAIHIMGEMVFVHLFVSQMHLLGIPCYASSTERISEEKNGEKISIFKFVQFRSYRFH